MSYARSVPQTFECRPTIPKGPPNVLPDELMIAWGGLPRGARAEIYLPAVESRTIMAMSGKLYGRRTLAALDPHTIECAASGVTYVPLPAGPVPGPCYAGLLTIGLPAGAPIGQTYPVIVRQLTTVFENAAGVRVPPGRGRSVRKALGAFQINIVIQSASSMLEPEKHTLAQFRWILARQHKEGRWRPVLQRYVEVLASRVDTLGGNAALIQPSQTGAI